MNEFLDRKPFVSALIEVLNTAIAHYRHEDAEMLLRALRVLRPDFVQLGFYEAMIAIRHSKWRDAIQVLNNIDAIAPSWAICKALMAVCKFAIADSSWHVHANEVLDADPHGQAAQFMLAMMGDSLGKPAALAVDMPPWPDCAQDDLRSAQHAGYRFA